MLNCLAHLNLHFVLQDLPLYLTFPLEPSHPLRRSRHDDRVRAIEIEVDGGGLQEAGPLSHMLEGVRTRGGETQVTLRLRMALPTAVDKQEALKILDQLPIPVEGTIAATLEVLADE